MLHAAAPLLQAELGWSDTGLLQRKVNRQVRPSYVGLGGAAYGGLGLGVPLG
jgi:hypothetical protein